jgi:hypothetical protein
MRHFASGSSQDTEHPPIHRRTARAAAPAPAPSTAPRHSPPLASLRPQSNRRRPLSLNDPEALQQRPPRSRRTAKFANPPQLSRD